MVYVAAFVNFEKFRVSRGLPFDQLGDLKI
jgi:hypothetical protein